MRLVVYQSLTRMANVASVLFHEHASKRGRAPREHAQATRAWSPSGQHRWGSGFDITLPQLEAAFRTKHSVNPELLTQTRLLVRLLPSSGDDVSRQLDSLSSLMTQQFLLAKEDAPFQIDLVVIRRPSGLFLSTSNESPLTTLTNYLCEALPHGAKFLEAHPSIGYFEKHGQRNSHGLPMDTHVIGVCHDLHHFPDALVDIVDILPPTRLSFSVEPCGWNDSEDDDTSWEAVRQATDHFSLPKYGSESPFYSYMHHVWNWQRDIAKAKESYVSCFNPVTAKMAKELFGEG